LPSTTVFTGSSAYEFMKKMVSNINTKYPSLDVEVIKVMNDFYGHTITVAGLLTAGDIINESKKHDLKERILIPDVMLRTGEAIFLDDVTLSQFEEKIKRSVYVTKVEGQDFLDHILGRKLCQNQ